MTEQQLQRVIFDQNEQIADLIDLLRDIKQGYGHCLNERLYCRVREAINRFDNPLNL